VKKTNVSKTISVPTLRVLTDMDPYQHPEDDDRDGLWNIGFFPLFNPLTWLIAWENVIIQSCWESKIFYIFFLAYSIILN